MDKKKPNNERFTEHAHVTPEEAGSVKADGKELFAGDDGFMEALAKEAGFTYEDKR